ncbi:MAG: type II CRISPR RNA-guided endonuclease Cas9 [Phycisphaerales bacterium]|nr:type II CRISPR RNA-guided endonuclease Cas9 [Phycisphaerales bacterium]
MKSLTNRKPCSLGLDVGVASIGWALVAQNEPDRPAELIGAGVHAFDEGVEGDIESGRDEARGAARRLARLPRRMFWRRQRRRYKLLRLLQRAGLLPEGAIGTPQAMHEYLLKIDARLRDQHPAKGDRIAAHLLPYRLRVRALDHALTPMELGRALYHLAQRRGFLSNRKSLTKDEDEGVVKQGIAELQAKMDTAGARTLGEYLAGLDPETERIRKRWTARQMYLDEFNHIWEAQASHHPAILTPTFRNDLHRAIFFQRPLKSAAHLIGRCELVPTARRAATADRLFQRFRILQTVNNLEIIPPNEASRPLDAAQREKVISALIHDGDLTFAKIKGKQVLALPKGSELKLWSQDEEKKLPGHRTDEKMRAVFGDRWDDLPEEKREEIVLEILSYEKPDALERRAIKAWGLDPEKARELAELRLEQGHAAHSRKALRILIERMSDGTRYGTARRELFPGSFKSCEPIDRLPPLRKAIGEIRNPAVERTLTELRKLVNEIVRVFGKPEIIRIELARDLKRARKERERLSKENAAREKLRLKAKARILAEAGVQEPRRSDIEKALLWEECEGECPYTGQSIPFASLFGPAPQFDVEHILPFSRSLDNSFLNKTLCAVAENRDHKRNRTPFEAYSTDMKRYEDILARVQRFKGDAAEVKLRRFEMQQIPEDFVSRQLNDTRHAAVKAADYLALLYGGRTDANGRLRVQVSAGGLTAHVRNELGLNGILDDGGQKTREDHRHHAVDAIVVAMLGPKQVHILQTAAERASAAGRRLFAPVEEPWIGFLDDARKAILAIKVSWRQDRKLAGGLHEETNYSAKEHPHADKKGQPKPHRHVRKPVDTMSESQVDDIVDPVIRERVREWIVRRDAKDDSVKTPCPVTHTHDGREIPIKTVRIRKNVGVEPVGLDRTPEGPKHGARTRYVKPGANHHTVIVATIKRGHDGNETETRWDDYPVTRLEAHRRKAGGLPIIQKDWGENRMVKFTLTRNEYLLIKDADGGDRLIRCISVSDGANEFRLHSDARSATEARKPGSGARIGLSGENMRKRGARKVRVTYIGEVIPCHD